MCISSTICTYILLIQENGNPKCPDLPGCWQRWWEPSVGSCNSSPMPRWFLCGQKREENPWKMMGFYWILLDLYDLMDFYNILWHFMGFYLIFQNFVMDILPAILQEL